VPTAVAHGTVAAAAARAARTVFNQLGPAQKHALELTAGLPAANRAREMAAAEGAAEGAGIVEAAGPTHSAAQLGAAVAGLERRLAAETLTALEAGALSSQRAQLAAAPAAAASLGDADAGQVKGLALLIARRRAGGPRWAELHRRRVRMACAEAVDPDTPYRLSVDAPGGFGVGGMAGGPGLREAVTGAVAQTAGLGAVEVRGLAGDTVQVGREGYVSYDNKSGRQPARASL
jgi:hypothetical protein